MTSFPLSKPQVALESQAPTQHTQLQTTKGAELHLGAKPSPRTEHPHPPAFCMGQQLAGRFWGPQGLSPAQGEAGAWRGAGAERGLI